MNNTTTPRRSNDEQFKRAAVALLEGGRKAAQLARDLPPLEPARLEEAQWSPCAVRTTL